MKNVYLVFIFFFVFSSSQAWCITKYDIEAAFIYKFLQYIDWPQLDRKNLYICFIGGKQIEISMNSLENKNYKNRKIKVKKISKIEQSDSCNILYIDNKRHDFEKLKNVSTSKDLLTIGNEKGFLESGGIINFVEINNKVGFEVNYHSAKLSRIKISSKLLRLASRVIK